MFHHTYFIYHVHSDKVTPVRYAVQLFGQNPEDLFVNKPSDAFINEHMPDDVELCVDCNLLVSLCSSMAVEGHLSAGDLNKVKEAIRKVYIQLNGNADVSVEVTMTGPGLGHDTNINE